MADKDIALMAHLMRRAGFGATYEELEARAAQGYEATVEELLHPDTQPEIERDVLMRYQPQWVSQAGLEGQQEEWTFRMINTRRPLEEKIALFWHHIFCTGHAKCEYPRQQQIELEMFRTMGMGNFQDLLMGLATDPAMVFYLDNCMSHKDAINENWGRELLELFSMGVGMDGQPNYTEDDVKECARAFTGWTVTNSIPRYPYGKYEAAFIYDPSDHDYGEKTFLGETGNWNGDDVVDIICKQPAAARFVARKLYDFFVADEPPVPAWRLSEPRDIEAIKQLEQAYFDSGYEISAMLRVLFTSDFFKAEGVRYAKVKSPADVVIGTMRMAQDHTEPKPGLFFVAMEPKYMGMDLLNPPTVEGWHMGREWINSGSLIDRINFASKVLGDTSLPGIQSMVGRLMDQGETLSAEQLVDGCLDLVGPLTISDETRTELVGHVARGGELRHSNDEEKEDFSRRVGETFQMIATTSEFQFG